MTIRLRSASSASAMLFGRAILSSKLPARTFSASTCLISSLRFYPERCLHTRQAVFQRSLLQCSQEDVRQVTHGVSNSRIKLAASNLVYGVRHQRGYILTIVKRILWCFGRNGRSTTAPISTCSPCPAYIRSICRIMKDTDVFPGLNVTA